MQKLATLFNNSAPTNCSPSGTVNIEGIHRLVIKLSCVRESESSHDYSDKSNEIESNGWCEAFLHFICGMRANNTIGLAILPVSVIPDSQTQCYYYCIIGLRERDQSTSLSLSFNELPYFSITLENQTDFFFVFFLF